MVVILEEWVGYAHDRHVIYISSYEEIYSLQSTGMSLNQCSDGDDEKVDDTQVESQASKFQYGVVHMFLRLIPEQEGVVARFRDGDSVVDLPR